MKAISARIKGRVQGVGFRYFVFCTAKHLGVNGYVMNCFNGDVYLEAEASNEILVQFIEECRKGPIRSEVMEVEINEIEHKGYGGFEISG